MPRVAVCRGCDKSRKLIRAHIVPQSFFVPLRGPQGEPPRLVSNIPGFHPKRSPIGPYDEEILCSECEQRFSQLDDYGQKVLLQREESHEILYHRGTVVGWQVANIDADLLKLFFVGVLWRASISTTGFFKNVHLGPFEPKAKKLVWTQAPGTFDDFNCVLAKFRHHPYRDLTLNPHQERWSGVKYYRFYLRGYVVMIKADARRTPEQFRRLSVGASDKLTIIARDVQKSREIELIHNLVATYAERQQ